MTGTFTALAPQFAQVPSFLDENSPVLVCSFYWEKKQLLKYTMRPWAVVLVFLVWQACCSAKKVTILHTTDSMHLSFL